MSLLKRRQLIEEFLASFDAMIRNCDPVDNWPDDTPSWRPKPGRDAIVNRQASELHVKTAVAAEIVERLGLTHRWKPRGTFQTMPVNPVLAWPSIFQRDPITSTEYIYSSCNQAIGLLTHGAEEAHEHEQSVTGRIEHAADAPRRLWRAVRGAPRATSEHKTAFASGILVTAIGGAIGTYLAHLLHWL